ncbi:phosphoenolpyruvate--protein phosphotransferase [Pseudovibrio brasiliensis]|uniref:phosphoenolpyruvate--protein phosphotransferase n=1 Tax=Pseudovibrio brasiliensis TaxID=1898042 RepID=A0ABX8AKJ3_9HYPH|nr:phosphoenolpyruvate--protein phosphotransferase [Pseudovibrio brasiliensis]QUS55579.1 phosphoenolpyruvate--protein phosphotransferase [Pseudovibrio brasiliensis]
MRSSLAGPRVLLRKLREVMAEPINAQERLDKIVRLIAANVVAEVCSVYILRADGVLELYATEGLNKDAVHQTSLKVGEGLVGLISSDARPLNLPNAQAHPAFAYRPETGEENYNSFLGVPILRAGRTLGVLVVQNKDHRTYFEDEVEALQTTAMVIAEMVAAGELEAIAQQGTTIDVIRPMHLKGVALADGIGLGHVVLHEPRVVITNLIAEDADTEKKRLEESVTRLRQSLDHMLASGEFSQHGEHREVLEAYRMFAYDRGWIRKIDEAIRNGLTAEAAVEKVQSDTRAQMLRQTDPYLRERLHDLDDLAHRLIRELMGKNHSGEDDLPKDAIIIARNMGAAELLDYDRDRIRGLVLEESGPTSHVTIVARALGIPTVGQVEDIVSLVEATDAIIVDGEIGQIFLRPANDVEQAFADKVRLRSKRQEIYRQLRDEPTVTKDGVDVKLQLNAGLLVDLPSMEDAGADGVGLFRTELQFMVASAFPRMQEQHSLYSKVLDAAGDKPVTFRSLDIGGDKVLPYLRLAQEENPAMGWRAIRFGLDRPGLLRTQIRAMLHAGAGRSLRIMFPMVADVSEFQQARDYVERELKHLRQHGHDTPKELKLGVMLEVPALLYQLEEIYKEVDFVSVGSNDLFQFFYAVDRGNTLVAERFEALSPSFLRALRKIVVVGDKMDTPVTLCGELGGQPLAAMALLAIGYRNLSMSPASIGPVKAMLRSLDLSALSEELLKQLEAGKGSEDIREFLTNFASENNIPV